jgi:aminopeptidase C
MFRPLEEATMIQSTSPELRAPSQQVFYHALVDWGHVDAIVFLTDPTDHPHVRMIIFETLDHVVMTTVLEHLPRPQHEVFLEMCVDRFADPEVLSWLEGHVADIATHIKKALDATKNELHSVVSTV